MFRYEDVIFRKRDWVEAICDWYGWTIAPEVRNAAADRFDLLPEIPDPDAHVRQVRPGNHRTELAPATIARMDDILRRWLRLFRYD